jgi:hypothetical protein
MMKQISQMMLISQIYNSFMFQHNQLLLRNLLFI